jgi:hypothetical protein
MDEQSKHILGMDDSDFLSFLYAERDRENSLSQFQGWNNWALVGAFVAAACAGFSIAQGCNNLNWKDVFYFSGGLFSIYLIYNSWWRFATKRERGVDFSKVRMLKEVVPIVQIVFIILTAIASAIIIPFFGGLNNVFWGWIVVLTAMAVVIGFIIVLKNKLVPSFFEELFLPWIWVNVSFVALLSGILGMVYQMSFKMTESGVLSSEFSVAACIVACLIVLFVFFTINTTNKSLKRFDAIIDKYLYLGASKEETLHEVIKNRMGYGVLDSCDKEIALVQEMANICEREAKELEDIKHVIIAGGYTLSQLRGYQRRIKEILENEQKALSLSSNIAARVKEIMKVASIIKDKSDLEKIFDTNQAVYDKVKIMTTSIMEIADLVEEKVFAKTEVKNE